MRGYWGAQMSMIFQDPMTSLNPVMKIGKQITESIRQHLDVTKEYATELAESLLTSVRIPEPAQRLKEYPHQLSGGMRQRVCIAVALACGPKLLFADEPTTALDVTVQAQVLDLIAQQQRERFMSMMLVTHDLGVVAGRTDEIAVMYAGRIVEKAPTERALPRHEDAVHRGPDVVDPAALGAEPHATGDDPGPTAGPRASPRRLQVRPTVRVRAGPVPRGGAAADPGRRPCAPVPLLVPGRLPGGRGGAREQPRQGRRSRRVPGGAAARPDGERPRGGYPAEQRAVARAARRAAPRAGT